jgi:hypothetical protein
MSFYRGTDIAQDARFKNKEKLLREGRTYPAEFDVEIDFSKVNNFLIYKNIKDRFKSDKILD